MPNDEKSFNTTETSYSYLAPRRGTIIIKNTSDSKEENRFSSKSRKSS